VLRAGAVEALNRSSAEQARRIVAPTMQNPEGLIAAFIAADK